MRLSYLKTHWTLDEAHSMLTLLDELRELLWQTYGSDIIDYQKQAQKRSFVETDDEPPPF